MPDDLSHLIVDLYTAEINASLSWFYDGGFDVAIGDELNGWKAREKFLTLPEAANWLRDKAIELYPDSDFAGIYRHGS